MITQTIEPSCDFFEAVARFQQELKSWIDECVAKYEDAEPTDGHDQFTYTTGWLPWLRCNDDARVIRFLRDSRDRAAAHFNEAGMWKHGYWTRQEAHHGTEHFDLFLRFLVEVDPDDAETKRQLLDATEHLGNWVAGMPEWFDRTTGLFRSFWFGTEAVGREDDDGVNIPEHLRCVNLCLLAQRVSGDKRNLDFARDYARLWSDAICDAGPLPIGLTATGPLRGPCDTVRMPRDVDVRRDELLKAENLLASNAIGAFLELWNITGEARFLAAVERLLDVLSESVDDACAGAAADAIRRYRRATGKDRYDDRIATVCAGWSPERICELGMEPIVHRPGQRVGIGVGKRGDMPDWFENGEPRRCSPITLALAAEIAGDARQATMALDLGRTYLALARSVYPDGREHGCSARSVSAIARGHGRDNHAGVTTAVLGPLIETFTTAEGSPLPH